MKKALIILFLALFCISTASAARIDADSEDAFLGTWQMEAVYLDSIQVGFDQIVSEFGCSQVTATEYVKRLRDELHLIVPVEGKGKGKYIFLQEPGKDTRQD